MSDSAGVDALKAQLQDYNDKIVQVEALLLANPSDTACIKLKQDLLQAMKLTHDLVAVKQGGTSDAGAPAAAGSNAALFGPGSRVEVEYDTRWYPAQVLNCAGDVAEVQFFGLGTKDSVDATRLRALPAKHSAVSKASLVAGARMQAKYAMDGKWYAVRVDAVHDAEDGTYNVTFLGYNEPGVVPLEYIRPMPTASDTSKVGEAFEVPEHLKPQPTDTEAEKERKRTRVRSLKKKHRLASREKERSDKQASWQQFQAKLGKRKRKPGSGVGGGVAVGQIRKQSIFRAPQHSSSLVESGVGMTANPARKKVKSAPTTSY
jgi:survival-of-motor-neuron-related-splicing factor 30